MNTDRELSTSEKLKTSENDPAQHNQNISFEVYRSDNVVTVQTYSNLLKHIQVHKGINPPPTASVIGWSGGRVVRKWVDETISQVGFKSPKYSFPWQTAYQI